MTKASQERVLELFEKGVLTQEEARACFLELGEEDILFVEEKKRLGFTMPSFKVFSSSKAKQEYFFDQIETLNLKIPDGKITFTKNKNAQIRLNLQFSQQAAQNQLPQVYLEGQTLRFESNLPCQISLALPDRWFSVLEMDVGKAEVKLDYLPFEDVTLTSREARQGGIRIISQGQHSQHIFLQVRQADVQFQSPRQQAVKGRIESGADQIRVNRKKKSLPYLFEKEGQTPLYVQVRMREGQFHMKGIHDARIL